MFAFIAVWSENLMFFVRSYLISTRRFHMKSFEYVRSMSLVFSDEKSRIFRWLNVRCMSVENDHDCGR